MMTDSLLAFVPINGNLSLVGATGATFPSTNTYDILGQGVGTAPLNIIGTPTIFGSDEGIGGKKLQLEITVGTGFVTANAATLAIRFEGAPDLGTPTYLPGTWGIFSDTGPMAAANLTAGTVIRMDWPAAFPANFDPRYYRLLFVTPAGTNFSAGTIASAIPVFVRDDQNNKFAAKNFSV